MQDRQLELRFKLLSRNPTIAIAKDVLAEEEINTLAENLSNRHWLAGQRIPVQQDQSGTSFEITARVSSPLWRVHQSIIDTLEVKSVSVNSIRIRDYQILNSHKPHCDHFSNNNKHLLFSAILYLNTTEQGGETHFPSTEGSLSIDAEKNTLAFWINYNDDGSEDFNTLHESLEVKKGNKLAAIFLFYGNKSEVPLIRERLINKT